MSAQSAKGVLFCLRESGAVETRVALTPESARKLIALGLEVGVESGAGQNAGFTDTDYAAAGVTVVPTREQGLRVADVLIAVHCPPAEDLARLKTSATTISFLDPFSHFEEVEGLRQAGLQSVSLELIPRTTLAQKMDALSSQASLAGYAAVLLAANRLDKIFPMMMTPAGTLQPAKVLVIGVGVAGLQAIATAKRLGARVTAFDTRPTVEEQVKSLGARFLKIQLGETGQTEQGYAKELTPEQISLQQVGMAKACAESDVVITTAQVFGRPAPRLITDSMVAGMRPGSVVLDLAVGTGGNVEGSVPNQETIRHGVRILGAGNLPCHHPRDASLALSANIANLISHFWHAESGLTLAPEDEIARSAVVTRGGEIVSPRVRELLTSGTT